MLTVNIKHSDYTETVIQAVSIHANWSNDSSKYSCVSLFFQDGTHEEYDHGIIFVMNEQGKTVAKYKLQNLPPPKA